MYIQEKLKQLQQWARAGVSLTKLPSIGNYGSEESELALLQYCYYRLIDHVAGKIIENPNYDVHELVDVLLSSPIGNCVSKEIVVSLCELLMTSDLRPYCRGPLFPHGWTADDVAGTIHSLQGGSEDLLKAAIDDYFGPKLSSVTTSSFPQKQTIKQKIFDELKDILSNIPALFQPDELAYLTLQQKNERQIRDKVAWELQKRLDKQYFDSKGPKLIVRCEWPSAVDAKNLCYQCSGLSGRSAVDLAVLLMNDNRTDYEKVVALIEFKADSFLNNEDWPYIAFAEDVEKMQKFTSLIRKNNSNDLRISDSDLYFVFLLSSHDHNNDDSYASAVTYKNILDKGAKRSSLSAPHLYDENNPVPFINARDNFFEGFVDFTKIPTWIGKRIPLPRQIKYNKVYPLFKFGIHKLGYTFGYKMYLTGFLWGPYLAKDIKVY